MPRRKAGERSESPFRPARTPEEREQQLTSLAYDLAETQILEGSASSQVITHFLKVGSLREQLEQERMEHEIELMEAKRQATAREGELEEMMRNAMHAFGIYSGNTPPPDDDELR